MQAGKYRACPAPSRVNMHERSYLVYLGRAPEETEKERQAAAEKAVTEEEFQGEWTASALVFTAEQPEVIDWSEHEVPSCPVCSSSPKPGASASH